MTDVRNTAFSALLSTAVQELTPDLLAAKGYKQFEFTYCATQLARAAVLWQFDNSALRILATPFLLHYYYQFFKDDRRYNAMQTDPTADAIATYLTVATLAGYDIMTSPTGWLDAISSTLTSVATSLTTKSATRGIYQLAKNGLFAWLPDKTHATEAKLSIVKPSS